MPESTVPPRLSLLRLRNTPGRPPAGPYTLDIAPGERVVLMGPSGAGKSVLLRLVADLDPGQGEVQLDGRPRESFTGPAWRQQVMYVAAEPAWWSSELAEHFPTPGWQALPPLVLRLGLREAVLTTPVPQLSTGERQRLALLRALLRAPAVLLLDEPTAALDEDSTAAVETLLQEHQTAGLSLLWITHSRTQAQRLGGRCLWLQDGLLHAQRPATAPAHP